MARPPPGCPEVGEQLSGWLDGELAPAEAEAVRRHLGACPGCARFAAELRATVGALRRLGAAAVSRGRPGTSAGRS